MEWTAIIALIVGAYEVVIRVIPTVSNYSLLHKIINLLSFVSVTFNRVKK
jgi:hypothetical protein